MPTNNYVKIFCTVMQGAKTTTIITFDDTNAEDVERAWAETSALLDQMRVRYGQYVRACVWRWPTGASPASKALLRLPCVGIDDTRSHVGVS